MSLGATLTVPVEGPRAPRVVEPIYLVRKRPPQHVTPALLRVFLAFVRSGGATDKVIAHELGLTLGTVKVYMMQLCDALGVATRTRAGLMAYYYTHRRQFRKRTEVL